MNKQEIQSKLDEATKRRMVISDNILGLKEQLAEAEKLEKLDKFIEKPKLRHGDFGVTNAGLPYIIIGDKVQWLSPNGSKSFSQDYHPDSICIVNGFYGNLVDLLKGWDKPFEEWGDSKASKGIKIVRNRIEFYACTYGGCSKKRNHCSEDAEEFHNALGHAIAELKQSKEISGKK